MKKINTIYIISYKRPQCWTAKELIRIKYPGEWFIVVGNNDDTINEYIRNFGKDKIIIFDWYKIAPKCDYLDNFGLEKMSNGAIPVRNAVREISENRGELRHWQLDDDYLGFYYFDNKKKSNKKINNGKLLEKIMYKIAEFGYKANLPNVGFCLTSESYPSDALNFSKRVFNAHNLINDKDIFVEWRGRLNDDLINAIECWQNKLRPEFSFKFLSMNSIRTQKVKGGLTDIYQEVGTVRKTAYAILINPLATKLVIKFQRYHHDTDWQLICPKILHEKYA